jgi:hypothetical protein
MSLEFEWDQEKAAENLRRHGVSFPQAALAFYDLIAVELFDDRRNYGEDRFIHIGMTEGQILTVVYTEREDNRIRIISARKASKDEQAYYYRQSPS